MDDDSAVDVFAHDDSAVDVFAQTLEEDHSCADVRRQVREVGNACTLDLSTMLLPLVPLLARVRRRSQRQRPDT